MIDQVKLAKKIKRGNENRRQLERQRVAQGVCPKCGTGDLDIDYKTCAACRSKKREEETQRLELRRSAGQCDKCGKNPPEEGRFKCRKCLDYHRKRNMKLRQEVFEAYGGARCACCGEDNHWFLQIDHIENDGKKHRETILEEYRNAHSGFYNWLKSHNYPAGFQVLCSNCNFAKGKYGTCPHVWSEKYPELPPEAIRSGRLGRRESGSRYA